MKKNLKQVSVIKLGDSLYTPLSTYRPEKNNGAVIITQVEEINEEDDGRIAIIDSDGDIIRPEWFGVSYFLSIEAMNIAFKKNEEKYGKRCTNSHICKHYSPCVKWR